MDQGEDIIKKGVFGVDEHGDDGTAESFGEVESPGHPFGIPEAVRTDTGDSPGGEKEDAPVVSQSFGDFSDSRDRDAFSLPAVGDKDSLEIIYIHEDIVDDDLDIIPDLMDHFKKGQAVEPAQRMVGYSHEGSAGRDIQQLSFFDHDFEIDIGKKGFNEVDILEMAEFVHHIVDIPDPEEALEETEDDIPDLPRKSAVYLGDILTRQFMDID